MTATAKFFAAALFALTAPACVGSPDDMGDDFAEDEMDLPVDADDGVSTKFERVSDDVADGTDGEGPFVALPAQLDDGVVAIDDLDDAGPACIGAYLPTADTMELLRCPDFEADDEGVYVSDDPSECCALSVLCAEGFVNIPAECGCGCMPAPSSTATDL